MQWKTTVSKLPRGRAAVRRLPAGRWVPLPAAALSVVFGGAHAFGGGTELHAFVEAGEENFGWNVSGLGDVNLDGKPDFAVGASGADAPGMSSAGSVTVYSGADGAMLYRVRGDHAFQRFGTAIAALGDVDADGRADYVVGAPSVQGSGQPPGHARVCSGLDGSEIFRVVGNTAVEGFAHALANIGDVTADGKADFAVGAPGVTGVTTGSCRVFSGADGAEVFALAQTGPTNGSNLGYKIAALGDVNADGKPDFAVSAPTSDPKRRSRLHIGEVIVVSGANGSVIRRHVGSKVSDRFGYSLAPAGDQDKDGVTDLLVGAIGAKKLLGEVTLWSGRTGRKITAVHGLLPRGFFGSSLAAVGDVDGDGRPEIAIGASGGSSGAVVVAPATKTKRPIYVYQGGPDELAGDFLAPIGDLDGDQRPELLLGGWSGHVARVVSINTTPLVLPAALSLKAAFQTGATVQGRPKGSFSARVKGPQYTITFTFTGLPPATAFYTLELEDGPGAGAFHTIGYVQVAKGRATVTLSAQYLPPGQLGVATLAQLSGRRIELRDGANIVLALTVP